MDERSALTDDGQQRDGNRGLILVVGMGLLLLLLVCGCAALAAFFAVWPAGGPRSRLEATPAPFSAAPTAVSGEGQGSDGRLLSEQGVLVTYVEPGSPAARAGLRRGSIILSVADGPVDTVRALRRLIEAYEPGDTVQLSVLNGAAPATISVTLGERRNEFRDEPSRPYLGIEGVGADESVGWLTPPTPDVSLPGLPGGWATISRVLPDTPAAAADLRVGDVITAVNEAVVLTRDEFAAALGGYQPGDRITLTLRRGPDTLSRTVTLAAHPDDPSRSYLGLELVP